MLKESYLGDGVYAGFDGWQVWVWTSDGIRMSEPIALEPEVLNYLIAFDKQCREPSER